MEVETIRIWFTPFSLILKFEKIYHLARIWRNQNSLYWFESMKCTTILKDNFSMSSKTKVVYLLMFSNYNSR